MRPAWIVAALAIPVLTAGAAEVLVLGPDGAPVASAAVVCEGSEQSPALTSAEGRASVPESCARVTCMSGRYLPGTAVVSGGLASCRLSAGARVIVVLSPPGCGARCSAALLPESPESDPVHRELREDPHTGSSSARLPLVPPGAYVVELRGADHWGCRSRIEIAQPAETVVSATWRGPTRLRGRVLGPGDRPVPDMPVRAVPKDSGPPESEWRCGIAAYAPDVFTASDGTFEIPVDLESGGTVEAGSSWDPDGYGSVALSPTADPLVIRVAPRR
jgi:hypothetical protein